MVTNIKLFFIVLVLSSSCFAVGVDYFPKLEYDIYIDANLDNLTATDQINYPAQSWLADPAVINYWYLKTGSASAINGTAFQGYGSLLPQLTMTINGLENTKTYDVYAVCWVKKWTGSEHWYANAALKGNPLKLCDYYTADIVFSDGEFTIQGAQVYLGQVQGVNTAKIDVDCLGTANIYRAWFDGVALVETTSINTLTPPIGSYDYTENEVVEVNAADYITCPQIYKFERWIGDVADTYSQVTTVKLDSNKTLRAVFSYPEEPICGDKCHLILQGDLNKDCMINFQDLAILAQGWVGGNN
jgi:hypothetical protein